MLAFTHTVASLWLGVYFNNWVLAFLAAFVWHLFCDTWLHWNIYAWQFKGYPYGLVALDIVSGLLVSWLLFGSSLFTLPLLAAIAGGNMPDVLQTIWEKFNLKKEPAWRWAASFFNFHENLQQETLSPGKGLISQMIILLVTIALL